MPAILHAVVELPPRLMVRITVKLVRLVNVELTVRLGRLDEGAREVVSPLTYFFTTYL
jgi:hypothetical protein